MSDPDASLDDAARALYGVAPEGFVAARTARAAAASGPLAAQITALRKPTVAAWAVNLLVGEGYLAEAVELSAALREAQDDLDARELTALGRQRRQVVAALTRRAAELAAARGTTLSPGARDAVSATINAAVLDERAAAAVLSGRLLRTLDGGDVDALDRGDLVAGSVPSAAPPPSASSRDELASRRAQKAAAAAAREAERVASDAARALARLEARAASARELADARRERAAHLRADLERADADAADAEAEAARLDAEREAARAAAETAAREAERARRALASGRDHDG
ncbi:transposase [Microbacterium sp. NPDC089189]|uniref:transposase n=1 Tax=Microbacterium sp. NPDC089189 TaxID=3154972 RepID=UPI0034201096